LKPSLFKNELLATSDPIYAWVFEGLWCLADREGRLEDRPRKIHLDVNAGRAYESTDGALKWLAENGFIVRYEHSGVRYIQVVKFKKHQNPHVKEAPSTIPAPGEHSANPVQVPVEHGSSPADSGFLNPDTPSLTAESNPPPSKTRSEGTRARRSRKCPASFEPDRAFALSALSDLDVEAELARFRDHEFREPRSDWDATWRNWIRTCKDTGRYAKKGNGKGEWL
jgi:hypothetical protein